jgi:hypothetical protein
VWRGEEAGDISRLNKFKYRILCVILVFIEHFTNFLYIYKYGIFLVC